MTDKGNNRDHQGKDAKEEGHQHQQKKHWQKKHWQKKQQQHFDRKKKDKDSEVIPVLKYGPNNNFFKFKEALSKTAL